MSNLRDRLRVQAALFTPTAEAVVTSVLRRGRRRRIIRGAVVAGSSLAVLLVGLGVWASIADRSRVVPPIEDALGANTKCGPALTVAKAFGRVDRWTAGETLTKRELYDHEKRQSGPGGPYTPYEPGDPGLDDIITLCVYDGDFEFASPPGWRPGDPEPVFSRIMVKIESGDAQMRSIGRGDRLLPPAAWEEARHGRPLPSPSP